MYAIRANLSQFQSGANFSWFVTLQVEAHLPWLSSIEEDKHAAGIRLGYLQDLNNTLTFILILTASISRSGSCTQMVLNLTRVFDGLSSLRPSESKIIWDVFKPKGCSKNRKKLINRRFWAIATYVNREWDLALILGPTFMFLCLYSYNGDWSELLSRVEGRSSQR